MHIAQQALRSYRSLLLIRGIIAILFGVLALFVSPGITLLVLVYLFGAYALVGGIIATVLGFRSIKEHRGWALLLFEGILSIIAGVAAFLSPGMTALVLIYLMAAWAIVTGITQIIHALMLSSEMGHRWLLGLGGLASVVFGALVILWPGAGPLTVIWIIGAYAIVFGVMYLTAYFQSRALTSRLV